MPSHLTLVALANAAIPAELNIELIEHAKVLGIAIAQESMARTDSKYFTARWTCSQALLPEARVAMRDIAPAHDADLAFLSPGFNPGEVKVLAMDLDSTLIPGRPEITGVGDRSKAGEMGASMADISGTLRLLVGGVDVSTYDDGGEQYDIHLQAEERYRNSREVLGILTVPSVKAGPVAVGNLLTLEGPHSPTEINR